MLARRLDTHKQLPATPVIYAHTGDAVSMEGAAKNLAGGEDSAKTTGAWGLVQTRAGVDAVDGRLGAG